MTCVRDVHTSPPSLTPPLVGQLLLSTGPLGPGLRASQQLVLGLNGQKGTCFCRCGQLWIFVLLTFLI